MAGIFSLRDHYAALPTNHRKAATTGIRKLPAPPGPRPAVQPADPGMDFTLP